MIIDKIIQTLILNDLLTNDVIYYIENNKLYINDKNIEKDEIEELLIEIKILIKNKFPMINVNNIYYDNNIIIIILDIEIYQLIDDIKKL